MSKVGCILLISILRVYRIVLSPLKGALLGVPAACRFTPTCSCYAIEAIQNHGARYGSLLAIRRLLRCHPWGGAGYDPVPVLNLTRNLHSSSRPGLRLKVRLGLRTSSVNSPSR